MTDSLERGDAGAMGSSVKPIYSERSMRCYAVTDSELQQLGFSSLLSTAFSAVAAGLLGFGIDLSKDLQLGEVDAKALAVAEVLRNLSLVGAVVCFVIAVAISIWRWNFVNLIKREAKG